MIGDPSGRSAERNLLDRETLEANVAAMRGQLERFLDFSPGPSGGRDGQQPRLARRAVADRLPARHRQALHDPVHARQGLRPDAPGARPVVHRVQLHAAPGGRLRAPVPRRWASSCRWAAPTSGATSPPGSSSIRRTAGVGEDAARASGPRARLQAPARPVRDEVRQERGRRLGLARRRADDAVRVLPVLARTPTTATSGTYLRWFTVLAARRDRGARGRRRRRRPRRAPRSGRWRATSRRGRTARPRRPRRSAIREALFSARRSPTPRSLRVAVRVDRRVHVRRRRPWPAGAAASSLARPACSPSRGEARRLIAGGGLTINGERVTRSGAASRSRSPGSGSRSASASAGARSGAVVG